MITKNLKVGDRFHYKSDSYDFEAICIESDDFYKERITKSTKSYWKIGETLTSSPSENKYITLISQTTKLESFIFKAKNNKAMETKICKK